MKGWHTISNSLGIAPAAPITTDEDLHRPCLTAVIRHVALNLFIACVVPATMFYTCLVTVGVWPAIMAALVWSYAAIAWRKLTKRRTSGLLILIAIAMTGRTAISLIADSTFLYFLQPIISDGVIAMAFLLSLATAQPLVARLAGAFYPMDHELHLRPRIRRLFWHLTLLWAAVGAGKAAAMLWLLLSQSVETFVLTRSIFMLSLNVLAVAVTITAAAMVARREGLMGPALATA
jgi:uncharacterized membrane protein YhaH (DUF805 family)